MNAVLSAFNLRLQITLLLRGYRIWLAIALGIIFMATLCLFLLLAPLKTKISKLQQDLNTAQVSAQSGAARKEPTNDTVQKQNKQLFDATLIQTERLPEALVQIHKIAAGQKLALLKAEYKYSPADSFGIAQASVALPLKADYPVIRRFCENVLQAMPYVSLDEISFKRENINVEQIDARIRFSVWMQTLPAASAPTSIALENPKK